MSGYSWFSGIAGTRVMHNPLNDMERDLRLSSILDRGCSTWTLADIHPILTALELSHIKCVLIWLVRQQGLTNPLKMRKLGSIYRRFLDIPTADQLADITALLDAFWKALWSIESLPNIHNFMRRTLSNALVVRENLHNRGMKLSVTCLFCVVIELVDYMLGIV